MRPPARSHPLALALLLSALLPGCGRDPSAPASAPGPKVGSSLDAPAPAATASARGTADADDDVEVPDPDRVVLRVNGHDLTQADFDAMLVKLVRPQQPLDPERMAALRAQIGERVEYELVMEVLLDEEIERLGLEPTPEEFAAHLAERQKELEPGKTIDSVLAKACVDRSWWEAQEKKKVALQRLRDAKGGTLVLTDAQIRAYYDEHIDDFQRQDTVEARHILVRVAKGATEAERAEKRKQIEVARARLIASDGEDFEEIAKEVSECPTGARGGSLGSLTRGQTVPPFEKAAFSQAVGEIGPIVETEYGFHVIQVLDRKPAGTVPFAEAAEKIRTKLETDAKREALKRYAEELRASAEVMRPGGEQTGVQTADSAK